ncbi:MAG: DNA (cytosine-5-)-methyltransferase [Nanoarchaeota archaeon]|nr:DNA (cytosine-5-)-methyltransferase [Nanoarchaeota archaeon]
MEKRGFKTLDLFAGVGGIRLAFENSGFETVFANDNNKQCKKTYDLNFNEPKLTVKDIWKIYVKDLPDFDILLAGFPCQAFSIAGRQGGFKDKETGGNLFFSIARMLNIKKPQAFMLENVKNLERHNKGHTFRVIKNILEKRLKYHIKAKVLNSMTHGDIPQNRERIFIVGFKDKKKRDAFKFPEETPLNKSFKEFVNGEADNKYFYNDKPLYERIKNDINSEDTVYQWRRKYVRANKKGVVPTLTANMGTGGHNVPIIKNGKGIRKLTPKECFMLQGFPKDFKLPEELADSKLYHQAGNSVTVPVVQRVAEEIKRVLLL